MRKTAIAIIGLIFLLLTVGCSSGEQGQTKAPTKMTLVLDWLPNTNHTGLYVAQAEGFYAEEGLEVDIVQPSIGGSAPLIAAGQGDIGVSYQEQVAYARAEGLPVVSLAAVIQHNTSGFAAPPDKGIKTPKDWEGKRYGGWGSEVESHMIASVMEKYGADPATVQEVNIGEADFFASIERDVDFTWIYYGWTGIEAELRGVPLQIIMPQDEEPALDFYTPVLIAHEEMIAQKPDLLQKFMRATAKGYQLAMANPEAAANILLAAVPELAGDLVRASQIWLADQYQSDAPYWGHQRDEIWQNYTDWLLANGLLEQEIDVAAAFTNEFLPTE